MDKIYDMCTEIQTHRLEFVLNPDEIWKSYNKEYRNITELSTWHEVKFLNDDASGLNSEIQNVPNDSGGVYIFVLKGNIIPSSHLYMMYIGRVQYTDQQNLRKRFREYFKDTRPKIMKMRKTWGKDLYIKFLPLQDNDIITGLEEELIRVVIPPCNDKYPKVISKAMSAAF